METQQENLEIKNSTSPSSLYPAWINASKFELLFREIITNFERIQDFSVQLAVEPGENYSTEILRVTAKVELKGMAKNNNWF